MNLTDVQRSLLADAAAGRLEVSGTRFYRDRIQLDVHAGWVAYDLLGMGLLVKVEQLPGKYTPITISDSGRLALAAVTAEEQS
jgi:hypothetical protein